MVLNINSPGGSPVQSDEIWQEIQYLKKAHSDKKLYAVIGDTGASGAYYIASAADEILVNPFEFSGFNRCDYAELWGEWSHAKTRC